MPRQTIRFGGPNLRNPQHTIAVIDGQVHGYVHAGEEYDAEDVEAAAEYVTLGLAVLLPYGQDLVAPPRLKTMPVIDKVARTLVAEPEIPEK
ncbi:MAG TPA: hypothetical protein VFG76_06830 [Candidatus Polarisedimenticolia bacterium]|nr:hypothetical protein [Candidatus Polarisedimenticolia bacterium]